MAGISILMVDDDKLLVDKLEETISWNKIGISMVFTAWNIRQAKAILKEYSIQILLCDVDMPQGSGLELVDWVRQEGLDIECAILSSYANFAYAQAAMKLSSRDYLLKPISNANLELALSEIVRVVKGKHMRIEGDADEGRVKFWDDFMCGRIQDGGAGKAGDVLGGARLFSMQIVRIWGSPGSDACKSERIRFDNAVRNHAESFFGKCHGPALEAVVRLGDLEWGIAVSSEGGCRADAENALAWRAYLAKGITQEIGIYFGRQVNAGGLAESWANLESMEKRAVMNEAGILFEEDWTRGKECYQAPCWDAWEKDMLDSGNLAKTRDSILAFIGRQGAGSPWRKNTQAMFIEEFRMMLFKYLSNQAMNFGDIFEAGEYEEYSHAAYGSIRGTKAFVSYIFEKLEGNRHFDDKREDVIGLLKNYIEQHIGENLTRSVLASQVYLSKDYISKMFMREVGISIPNYISIRRIEKAKDYLKDTKLSVSRIAAEVGYSNFSYFSKSFRDQVGCTPNEYRKRSGGDGK